MQVPSGKTATERHWNPWGRITVHLSSCRSRGDSEIRILNRIVRVTERGLEHEADPRHVDLITESLKIKNVKFAASPGIKNPDASAECESKDNEPQCNRTAVIDPGLSPDSSVSSSATMQGGASAGFEPKSNDTIASLDGTRSVGDNNDAETAGTDHNNDAETDGTTCSDAETLLDLLCALTSDNALFGESNSNVVATVAAQRSGKAAATHVKIDDA